MTLSNFINNPRSVLIAPAGHGKTHAIASCIKICNTFIFRQHRHTGGLRDYRPPDKGKRLNAQKSRN